MPKIKIIIATITTFAFSLSLLAQAPSPAPAPAPLPAQGESKSKGPRKKLAMIIFAGLGGAVLGLSTLSFYGRPQDKLSNIAIGFAVGVIAGTVYVTYKTATPEREYYEGTVRAPPPTPMINWSYRF